MAFLSTVLAVLAAVTPLVQGEGIDSIPSCPRVTSVKFSGNGCPHDSGSVSQTGNWDSLGFNFKRFVAASPGTSSSTNCEVRLTSSGASSGWQVAVSGMTVRGHAVLENGASVDYYAQVFWQTNAGNTVRCDFFFLANLTDMTDKRLH